MSEVCLAKGLHSPAYRSAVQQLARPKLDFAGRIQSSHYPVFRRFVCFQNTSNQDAANVQSVERSTIVGSQKYATWCVDKNGGSHGKDGTYGNFSFERYSSAQSPHVGQGDSLPQPSWKRFRKEVEEPDSGSRVAGGRPPLTAVEEAEYASHVQDLLTLEAKKVELKVQLGRTPTQQEWADNVGISVFRLYARVGRGRAAKRKMVEANVLLVHSVARQFLGRGLSHDELYQQGLLGLLKSTEMFDSRRSTKFSSYAFFGVKNQMRIAAEKFGHALRIGQNVFGTVSSLLRHKDEFVVEHGRQPTCDELEEVSKLDAEKIHQLFRIMLPVKSLDAAEAKSCESSINGRNSSFQQLIDKSPTTHPWLSARDYEQKAEVTRVLGSLTPHQQQIMHLRYGLGGQPPLSRSEVAWAMGVTSTAVLTTEKRALERLRGLATEGGLMNYLDDNFWLR